MSKLDWTAQLVMLRGMTQKLGVLHEAQALQLRLWPYTVDPSLDKSEAKVDLEAKVITFVWNGSTLKIDKKYKERLQTLSDNVKFLLGEGWLIEVVLDGITIFVSDTNVTKPSTRRRSIKPKRPNKKRTKCKSARKGKR